LGFLRGLIAASSSQMSANAAEEEKPYRFLIHPKTLQPLSDTPRPVEEIWQDAIDLGFIMYGPKVGDVNCIDSNWFALPGMVVRVALGEATYTYDEEGELKETVEPYSYYALVTGVQRQWNTITRSWKLHETSGCAVQVQRIDDGRLLHDNKVWISTLKKLLDMSSIGLLNLSLSTS